MLSTLIASVVVFALINALPGDVAAVILGPNATPEAVAGMRQRLGLNRPLAQRYLEWITGLLSGNLGNSALDGQPVAALVAGKFSVTFSLVVLGMSLALTIAVPLGMFAAARRSRPSGFVVSALSQLGMSVPAFLAGIFLVVVFAVWLRWLPANGYVPIGRGPGQWAAHLVLPVASLALVQSAILTRYVRSAFIEVLNQDYFRTARAVGWRYWPALWRHGLRNAGLQILTVLGLQLATLFVGAIVIEQVFALPGLGSYLLSSVVDRDLPVVQSVAMLLVALVLIINMVVDVAYLLIDPRLRAQQESVDES